MTEREKLITAIERAREQSEEFGLGFIVVKFKETDLILELLKEQPEQKHGHWISFGCGFYRCSVCDDRKNMNFVPNYCSTCGAKMDEKMDNLEVKQNETD